MTKILITGGSGLLAINWASVTRANFNTVLGFHKSKVYLDGVETTAIDLDSRKDLLNQIKEINPDVVIHTAGLTNVDLCQENPKLAHYVNCSLSANVAFVCKELKVKLVHISTDHLFSGIRPMLDEMACPEPLNEYAVSKFEAEKSIQEFCPDALIIRTNFFGWGHLRRQSFSDWIIENLKQGQEISLFDDVFYSPIIVEELAYCVHDLLEKNAFGIFNVVSSERISKYEFGNYVCEVFGLSKQLVKSLSIASKELSAARPKDMSLCNEKLKNTIGRVVPSIFSQIELLKQQSESGLADELKNAIRGD